jgi:hypothetical protein
LQEASPALRRRARRSCLVMHLTNACGPQQVRDGPLVRDDQRRGRTAAAAKAICDEVEDDVGVVHPASRDGQSLGRSIRMRVLARRLPTTRCFRSALDLLLGEVEVDVLLPDEVPDADGTSRPAAYMAE